MVPIPRGLLATTAQAITKSDLLAFTAGLDAAMAIAAAIVLVTGIVAFLAVGISARATRVGAVPTVAPREVVAEPSEPSQRAA
jgi:hypothetical protein